MRTATTDINDGHQRRTSTTDINDGHQRRTSRRQATAAANHERTLFYDLRGNDVTSRTAQRHLGDVSTFRLLHLARLVVDEVNRLLDHARPRLINHDQLRECSGSITGNIREAHGRRPGPDRNQFLRYAKGSAEETDERLRTNYARGRLPAKTYWKLRDRLNVIVRMIDALAS